MQNIFTRTAPIARAKDVFAVCDLAGFADLAESVPASAEQRMRGASNWAGGKTYDESLSQLRNGDLSGVAASSAILDKIEADSFLSPVWKQRLDVVGGTPCVPAFLAGHPMNMRRRERVLCEQGPLTIIASLELSAGISADTMRQRGAAVLALTRILTNTRPVTLWAACSVGGKGYGAHCLARIDTAPLDLARAAHVLTCPSVTRHLGYASCAKIAKDQLAKSWLGSWAYSSHADYIRTARDNLKSAVAPDAETILLPAAHVKDPCVEEPVKWLKDMVAKYGGGITDSD